MFFFRYLDSFGPECVCFVVAFKCIEMDFWVFRFDVFFFALLKDWLFSYYITLVDSSAVRTHKSAEIEYSLSGQITNLKSEEKESKKYQSPSIWELWMLFIRLMAI